jgi:hypothetical protein
LGRLVLAERPDQDRGDCMTTSERRGLASASPHDWADHCTDARHTAGSGPLLRLWVVCARGRTRTERFSGAPLDGGLGALCSRFAVVSCRRGYLGRGRPSQRRGRVICERCAVSDPVRSRQARALAERALVRLVRAYCDVPEFLLLGGLVPDPCFAASPTIAMSGPPTSM